MKTKSHGSKNDSSACRDHSKQEKETTQTAVKAEAEKRVGGSGADKPTIQRNA
ncbi:MAG: hypothetical protein AAF604_01880 [Acidobacteriota bacterium]